MFHFSLVLMGGLFHFLLVECFNVLLIEWADCLSVLLMGGLFECTVDGRAV